MRFVAVTRILNEDDIVEAFVRHHAPLLAHHVFLDNGSTDRTIEILRSLREEGFSLTVFQNGSAFFFEETHNTLLYQTACRQFSADWVLFLDTDEFLDLRRQPDGLAACVGQIDDHVPHGLIEMINYEPDESDDAADILVPRRIRNRVRVPIGVYKCIVRSDRDTTDLAIEAGNHGVLVAGKRVEGVRLPSITMAHYQKRTAIRFLVKTIIGRLKVIAAGREEVLEGRSSHYNSFMDTMMRDPLSLLRDQNFMRQRNVGRDLVEDPIAYLGDPLQYTVGGDDVARSIRILAQYGQTLAESHGRMLDSDPTLRREVSAWNQTLNPII